AERLPELGSPVGRRVVAVGDCDVQGGGGEDLAGIVPVPSVGVVVAEHQGVVGSRDGVVAGAQQGSEQQQEHAPRAKTRVAHLVASLKRPSLPRNGGGASTFRRRSSSPQREVPRDLPR